MATSAVIAPRKDQAPISNVPVEFGPSAPRMIRCGWNRRRPRDFRCRSSPSRHGDPNYILILSGLPAGSGLTGAERISSDSWLLTPDALGAAGDHDSRMVDVRCSRSASSSGGPMALWQPGTTAWILVSPPAAPKTAQKSGPSCDEGASRQRQPTSFERRRGGRKSPLRACRRLWEVQRPR